jgi:hypothetical protein
MSAGVAALTKVAQALRAEGGLLADVVTEPAAGTATPLGDRVATGPRAAADPAEYAFVVEAVREGQLIHDGASRIVVTDDTDLALLAGDRLYALGLARLAERGDLESVASLADVISLCAMGHATGDPTVAERAWEAGVQRIGWGAEG